MSRTSLLLLAGGVLLLAGYLVACMPTDALDVDAQVDTDVQTTSESAVPDPTFTLLGMASQYQAVATFRGTGGVALGDSAAVFEMGAVIHRAPLRSGPSQFEEPGGTTVTQATYTLDEPAYRALTTTPPDSVTVRLQIGEAARAFPFQRGDIVE